MKLFKKEDIKKIESLARKKARIGLGDYESIRRVLIEEIGLSKLKEINSRLEIELRNLSSVD